MCDNLNGKKYNWISIDTIFDTHGNIYINWEPIFVNVTFKKNAFRV